MEKNKNQNPDNFIVRVFKFPAGAIYYHNYPENKSTNSQRDYTENKYSGSKYA
jgi:hypothetical protein